MLNLFMFSSLTVTNPLRMKKIFTLISLAATLCAQAQGPEVTSWIINTTGATGYNNIPSNIQQVQYSTNNVYVSATCIPGYSIGPWAGNPNTPANQNFVYKITRNPQQNTGTPVNVGLGHIGVWSNGVSIFNAKDAMSYNNQGVWNQNAYYWEGASFDNCLGHPAPNGEYHHHVSPTCLYDDADSTHHSPIIGYSFDGFPVYGAYGYANTNGTGGIKRMQSGFVLNTGTTRTNGPNVSTQYPLGCYCEDHTFTAGAGDLDVHNGRFCVTPEYPLGTYAYFVTIDANLDPVYPYTIGLSYYGTVQAGNTGPNGGHNTVTEPVVTYTPSGIFENETEVTAMIYPNPTSDYLSVFINPVAENNFVVEIIDAQGRKVFELKNVQPAITYTYDITKLAAGVYTLLLSNDATRYTQKVMVR